MKRLGAGALLASSTAESAARAMVAGRSFGLEIVYSREGLIDKLDWSLHRCLDMLAWEGFQRPACSELLDAETDEEFDRAERRMRLLCD